MPTGFPVSRLPTFDVDDEHLLNAVIETPKGSHNKFDYHDQLGLFYLRGTLPAGTSVPFDFGFIPATRGEDGDPLDVVVLTDDSSHAFPGCLVAVRLLGAIQAEQGKKNGGMERNDRLIAVAAKSQTYHNIRGINGLPDNTIKDIQHFFWSYNQAKGVEFKVLEPCGPQQALRLVEQGQRKYQRD